MSNAILMSGGADDIDFMIHGLFSYQLFGHTVWITTSHVCILIVMLVILIFAVIANRKIKHATEVPDGFQNVIELIVEKLDGVVMGTMGKVAGPKFVNYISTIFIFIFMSNISGLFGLNQKNSSLAGRRDMKLFGFVKSLHFAVRAEQQFLHKSIFIIFF